MDTHASCSILPLHVARRFGIIYKPGGVMLEGVNSIVCKSLGVSRLKVRVRQEKSRLQFQVVKLGS